MGRGKILVVDDEKNTRLTLEEALEPLGYEIVLAASGEEALERLDDPALELMLLDLKMPGVSGLEVLEAVEQKRPDLRVVILTAHGTVDSAVETMKHGAVDLVQKPVALEEIRRLVRSEMDPERREEAKAEDYEREVRAGRNAIREASFDAALGHLRRAMARDADRPEAPNLIGVIHQLRHDRPEAQKYYRLALDLDPTYQPARSNLENSTRSPSDQGAPSLGDEDSSGSEAESE